MRKACWGWMIAVFVLVTASLADARPWLSENGRYVAFHADYRQSQVAVWDIRQARQVCRIVEPHVGPRFDLGIVPAQHAETDTIFACAVSESAGLVATATEYCLSMWDLTTGEQLWTDRDDRHWRGKTTAITFFPDGRHFATLTAIGNGRGRTIVVRRAADGEEPTAVDSFEAADGETLGISPDGQRIYAFVGHPNKLRCWETEEGAPQGDFAISEADKIDRPGLADIGNQVIVELVQHNDHEILVVWDAETRTELRRIVFAKRSHGDRPLLLPGERRALTLVSRDANAVVAELDLHTGETVARHLVPNDMIHLSNHARSGFALVPGTSSICWMGWGDRTSLYFARRGQPTSHGVELGFQSCEDRRDTVTLVPGGGVGNIVGSPKTVDTHVRRDGLKGSLNPDKDYWTRTRIKANELRLDPKLIERTLDRLLTPEPPPRVAAIDHGKPRVFVLAVGIGDYARNEYDLRHAASDARAVAARLLTQHGHAFGDVRTHVLADGQATRGAIRDGLAWLKRSVTPTDVTVVFFSGHAVRAKKGLYYFSHDGDSGDVQNTCLNWSEVADTLATIDSAGTFFLSDCCHAGAFAKDKIVNQEALAQAIDARGSLGLLASSSGDEQSLELDALGHGAFTHVVLEGLQGRADADADGAVSWPELSRYVERSVPILTDGRQHPRVLKETTGVDAILSSNASSGAQVVEESTP